MQGRTRPRPMIDFVFLAELIVAILIVATLNPREPAAVQQPSPSINTITPAWSPDTDLHALRVLRLEREASADNHQVLAADEVAQNRPI